MPCTEHILIAGDRNRACEDMIIAEQAGSEGLLAVLDGASELNGVNLNLKDPFGRPMTGGEWVVHNAAAAAARRMRHPISHGTLMELVKALEMEAMHDVVRRTDVEPWQRPACAGIFVRVTRDMMHWLQFGDCRGAAELYSGSLVMLGEDRIAPYDNAVLKVMAGAGLDWQHDEIQKKLRENLEIRNISGYAVLDGNLNPMLCTSGVFPRADVKRFVLFSNGVFHEPHIGAHWFAEMTLRHGPLDMGSHVQSLERDDHERKRFPRFKQHDDKAALLVTP